MDAALSWPDPFAEIKNMQRAAKKNIYCFVIFLLFICLALRSEVHNPQIVGSEPQPIIYFQKKNTFLLNKLNPLERIGESFEREMPIYPITDLS